MFVTHPTLNCAERSCMRYYICRTAWLRTQRLLQRWIDLLSAPPVKLLDQSNIKRNVGKINHLFFTLSASATVLILLMHAINTVLEC